MKKVIKACSFVFVLLLLGFTISGCSVLSQNSKNVKDITVKWDNGTPSLEIPPGFKPENIDKNLLSVGSGDYVQPNGTVTVRYVGYTADGNQFAGNFDKKSTTFKLDDTIVGWQQGLAGLKVGSKLVLAVPGSLGFTSSGNKADVPENSDLVYYIEILKATKPSS